MRMQQTWSMYRHDDNKHTETVGFVRDAGREWRRHGVAKHTSKGRVPRYGLPLPSSAIPSLAPAQVCSSACSCSSCVAPSKHAKQVEREQTRGICGGSTPRGVPGGKRQTKKRQLCKQTDAAHRRTQILRAPHTAKAGKQQTASGRRPRSFYSCFRHLRPSTETFPRCELRSSRCTAPALSWLRTLRSAQRC